MKLHFNNGKFVILQVSDAQDLSFARKTMLRMLNKAYDAVKPDLVLFTGDNILGNHLRDARFGSRKTVKTKEGEYVRMKKAIHHICSQPEERSIPFAMIYGNHDDMNEITKDEQAEIYAGYSMNIGCDNPDKSVDCDTYNIPIYDSASEKIRYNIWMLDSAWKDKKEDKCYTSVTQETINWYIAKSNELKAVNGGKCIDSLMFQHIPMPENARLMEKCDKDAYGAVRVGGKKDNAYVRLNPMLATGHIGEPIQGYEINNGQFEAVKKQGDVRAVVSSHEHLNNYEAELDGVKLIQSSGASFRCYGDESRGVRVFEIDEHDTSVFNTYFMTYDDICGRNPLSRLAFIWDADGMFREKTALISGGALVLGAVSGAVIHAMKGKHND